MNVIQVKFAPWDKAYNFDAGEHSLKRGDWVLVDTEIGTELAQVVNVNLSETELLESSGGEAEPVVVKPIVRQANSEDIDKIKSKEKQRREAFVYCKKIIRKINLPMKLFDVRFSYDGGKITFAYIAPERVDFRDLVKELTRKFQKSIRMHQVGVREETRLSCSIGLCGRDACCRRFLKDLGNISLDQAYLQQVAHRGSGRISGVCGRLLCCLKYEQPLYESLSKNLPALGSEVKTPQGQGTVIGWHVLKQTVDVRIKDQNTTIEISLEK